MLLQLTQKDVTWKIKEGGRYLVNQRRRMLLGQLRGGCYLDTNAADVAWATNTGAFYLAN